jgi:class 3 adenylate cyclase
MSLDVPAYVPSGGMNPSEIRYAKSGDVHIAYQLLGNGPTDLVLSFSAFSHLEVMWEEPSLAQMLRRIAEFSRFILFDKRGVGLSDRNVGIATLEDRMDDIRAVMDAVGSPRAVLFGTLDGASLSALFAATYPEKTIALVLWDGRARSLRAPDYPWATTREQWEDEIRRDTEDWGSEAHVKRVTEQLAPSRLNDREFLRWMGRRIRFGASPAAGMALSRMNMQIDIRSILPAIHVPTLVLYTPQSRASSIEDAKFLATHIPGAQLEEVNSPDHLFWTSPEGIDQGVSAIRRFVQGVTEAPEPDRILTTVLFTDIVNSTRQASQMGDRRWGELLERHLAGARLLIPRHRGVIIKTTGDGLVATFDGPTRAVRCALALQEQAHLEGLAIRAGLHTGECVLRAGDVQGIAVHIASRVADRAEAGQVLVSGTVRELSVGSDISFKDRGLSVLRGVEGRWRLYAAGEGKPTPTEVRG